MPLPPPVLPQIQTPNLAAAYLQGLQLKNQMEKTKIAAENAALDRQVKIAELGFKGEELGIKRDELSAKNRTADAKMLEAQTKAQAEQRKQDIMERINSAFNPGTETGGGGLGDPRSHIYAGLQLAKLGGTDKDVRGMATLMVNIGKAGITMNAEDRKNLLEVEVPKSARAILSGNMPIEGIDPQVREIMGGAGIRDDDGDGMVDIPTNPTVRAMLFNIAGGSDPTPAGYQESPEGLTPRPGGPATKIPVEAAAKQQMMATAKGQLPLIKSLIFNEDGSINQVNVAAAYTNFPGSDGRRLRTAMEVGIQAITRAETGAAMPPEEVDNTRQRFQPSPWDDDKTKELKLQMFEEFINGNLKLLDHAGNFSNKKFNEELKKRGGKTSKAKTVGRFKVETE